MFEVLSLARCDEFSINAVVSGVTCLVVGLPRPGGLWYFLARTKPVFIEQAQLQLTAKIAASN